MILSLGDHFGKRTAFKNTLWLCSNLDQGPKDPVFPSLIITAISKHLSFTFVFIFELLVCTLYFLIWSFYSSWTTKRTGDKCKFARFHWRLKTCCDTRDSNLAQHFTILNTKAKYYKHLKKRCSPKPFGQTKNGLVSGRLACTLCKPEILNKIGI